MGPVSLPSSTLNELTGNLLSMIDYHPASPRIPGAPFCLGETPDLQDTLFNQIDLRYSFHRIVRAEYGGEHELHLAAHNYRTNRALDPTLPDPQRLLPYEKVLHNLIVMMFAHYVDVFECHSSRFGHRTILVWECLRVAQGLGWYHRFVKRGESRDWTIQPPIPNDDVRWDFSTAVTALGDAQDPTYAHPLVLGHYFDQVYHQGRFPGELPKRRPGQATEITQEQYDREMAEIRSHLRSFDDPNFRSSKVLPPTSLVNPEIILPLAEYRQITAMKSGIVRDPIHQPVATFEADGAQARVDIAPGTPIPARTHDDPDDIDYESLYGVYYDDEGNLIPEYEDDIPDLENIPRGDATPESKVSTDTEQAGYMDHLSLTSPHITGTPQPKDLKVQLSTSSSGDVQKVHQILPPPPKFDQPAEQINIKDLVSNISRQVTQSVVGQLAGLGSSDTQADSNIWQALAAARRGPTATTSQPDNIQAILRAAKAGGLKAPTSGQTATQTTCGPPVAPVRPQQEQDTAPRGRPGRWNPDPLGLQADITAQQRERGREQHTGSAKQRSSSRPQDKAKRGRQTLSSDDSEPGIDWTKNKIGPAKWESTGPPKSPAKSSRFPGSGQSNTQTAPRYSQSHPTGQSEKKEESSRKEKAEEKRKKLEEDIVKNYPGTYISNRIVEMISERFTEEARSLRFFEWGAMSRTKEIVALADWGYQYQLILPSPIPDIPVFLQQSCFGSKNAVHDVPAAPLRILLETTDVRKKSRMLWSHLCVLLQFWTDEASYTEGNVFYGGLCREASSLVQYVMMRLNSRTRREAMVTWRDVVRGTPWLDIQTRFSVEQQAAFRLQLAPSWPNELEEMEAWWQVLTLRRKCAVLPAALAGELPGAPPNTPATDTEASITWSTGPEIINPTGTYFKPPPGINVPSSNQFLPTSGWTKLPNPRDTPATSTKYRSPFDELDLELCHSSLIETPLSRFETEEAVDGLLKQCPDLTGGPSHDVEMTDMTYVPTPVAAQSPSDSPVRFQPEISNSTGYNYNLMDQEDDATTAPASPVSLEDDKLLDMVSMVPSPVPSSRIIGTGHLKSTTPKKRFGGPEDTGTPK